MTSQRKIAANQRNGAKSRGPRTQEGKALSKMNALRYGLAAKITATIDDHATPEDSFADAMYLRLRQIEVERVKVLNDFYSLSGAQDIDKLQTVLRFLVALERYSQRSHSKLKKHISCGGTFQKKK